VWQYPSFIDYAPNFYPEAAGVWGWVLPSRAVIRLVVPGAFPSESHRTQNHSIKGPTNYRYSNHLALYLPFYGGQKRAVPWIYHQMMGLRRFSKLPNTPFYRLNIQICAQVHTNPLTAIRLQAWEF
jgi:hypothetical protein